VTTKLVCEELRVRVGDRTLVANLQLDIGAGSFVCVLGPNGVGKTLTLLTLAGLREPAAGHVALNGDRLDSLERKNVARRLGLLLQNHADAFPVTVIESALMGRHPRLGFWQRESLADLAIARNALADMDLVGLEQRLVTTLSGGERRRLALATLLVQDPDILLLDEPTNHLDPLHKITVLKRMQAFADEGKIVLACMHDPDLVARYAHSVLLMHGDGTWQFGLRDEMLTAQNLERLYHTPFSSFSGEGRNVLLPAAS